MQKSNGYGLIPGADSIGKQADEKAPTMEPRKYQWVSGVLHTLSGEIYPVCLEYSDSGFIREKWRGQRCLYEDQARTVLNKMGY